MFVKVFDDGVVSWLWNDDEVILMLIRYKYSLWLMLWLMDMNGLCWI